MIFLFGQSIIFWTGVLAGLLFIFSFLGCRCITGTIPINTGLIKYHNLLMKLAFIAVMIHMIFAVLASLGIFL